MFAVGVDVSNGRSTVAVLQSKTKVILKPFEVPHTPEALGRLVDQLNSLDGETRVDEQDSVLLHIGVTGNHEGGKTALHGTDGGDAVGSIHVEVKEILDEARGFLFQNRSAINGRVVGGHAVLQGLDLGFHADTGSGQTRVADLHMDELLAAGGFDVAGQLIDFADAGSSDARQATLSKELLCDVLGYDIVLHHISKNTRLIWNGKDREIV